MVSAHKVEGVRGQVQDQVEPSDTAGVADAQGEDDVVGAEETVSLFPVNPLSKFRGLNHRRHPRSFVPLVTHNTAKRGTAVPLETFVLLSFHALVLIGNLAVKKRLVCFL
jgi:hypothetical protein